jgi:hypothetical protein
MCLVACGQGAATTPKPKAAATTTAKPAVPTTTTPQFYTEISGDMVLDVDDTAVFQTNPKVVDALQSAMGALLEVPHKDVTITSVSLVEQYPPAAVKARRLGAKVAPAGKVKAGIKVKDPTNKLTPAKVKGVAPQLPVAANKNLKTKKVPAQIAKAIINAVAAKKPNNAPDPCKPQVVVAPPVAVAPANPCAPVVVPAPPPASPCAPVVAPAPVAPANPCAPVAKLFSEQGAAVHTAFSNSPALLGMFSAAVACLIGMVIFLRRRRQARDSSVYSSVQEPELE